MCLHPKQCPHANYIRIHPIASFWHDFNCCDFCPQLNVASHIVDRRSSNGSMKQYNACALCADGWETIADSNSLGVV